jgi:hypothetical protein
VPAKTDRQDAFAGRLRKLCRRRRSWGAVRDALHGLLVRLRACESHRFTCGEIGRFIVKDPNDMGNRTLK